MLLSTTEKIPGKDYEILGLVRGNCVQSTNIVKDFTQGLKTIVGGELKGYTEIMETARVTATERLVEHAESMGADAVIMLRYDSGSVTTASAEVLCFGTAVKFI
ncbi:heavy metal-binding domain-containing protein [Methanosphaera sp.]